MLFFLLRSLLIATCRVWDNFPVPARAFNVDSRFRLVPFFDGVGSTDEVLVNVFCNFFQFDESSPVAIASPLYGAMGL